MCNKKRSIRRGCATVAGFLGLILPFQFKIAYIYCVTFLNTGFAKGLVHTEFKHHLLEPAHGTTVFPICHLRRTFDGHSRNAPLVAVFALYLKKIRVNPGSIYRK